MKAIKAIYNGIDKFNDFLVKAIVPGYSHTQ